MNFSAYVMSDRWDYLCLFAPNIQITLLYINDKIASKDMQRVCASVWLYSGQRSASSALSRSSFDSLLSVTLRHEVKYISPAAPDSTQHYRPPDNGRHLSWSMESGW